MSGATGVGRETYVGAWQPGAAALLVARQPIVDRETGVVAYELLARRNLTDVAWDGNGADGLGSTTTARVIAQAFLDMDVWSITEGLPAYINFPRDLLLDGTVEQLPADITVVEILESVVPDDDVRRACHRLRDRGYRLALDDVVADDARLRLLDDVDVVKVDFGATTVEERAGLVERCRASQVSVLAEKVETPAQHAEAVGLGYDLFQGYFFQKPAVIDGRRPTAARLAHLQLLRSVLDPSIDRDAIGDVLARDPGAIERFVALAEALGWHQRTQGTVRDQLHHLEDRQIVRLGALLVVSWLAERHPRPLRDTVVIRARFCERIIEHLAGPCDPLDAYLVGMFSLLDALLDEPMPDVIDRIRPPRRLVEATLRHDGPLGRTLRLVQTYEHGDWTRVRRYAAELGVDGDVLGSMYLECLAWARRTAPPRTALR